MRLQMSEIEQLLQTGKVTESVQFLRGQNLIYSVLLDDGATTVGASFDEDEILIRVPIDAGKNWCEADEIGIEHNQVSDEQNVLKILLEKDFKCVTRREGERDMFPNPKEAHS